MKIFSLTKGVFVAVCLKMNVVMGSSGKRLSLLLRLGRREEGKEFLFGKRSGDDTEFINCTTNVVCKCIRF